MVGACQITLPGVISATVEPLVLQGTISPSVTAPRYPGPYDVTPAADAQALATKGLVMDSDVTVGGMGEAIEKAGRDAVRTVVDGSYTGEYRDEEVAALRAAAFQGCTGLTSVDLPAVETADNYAFQNCTGLTSVYLPALKNRSSNNYNQMGLFQNCTSLEDLDLPSYAWSGGNNTFRGCTSLKRLRLGKSTDCSGWQMFYELPALRTVDFGAMRMIRTDFHDSTLLDALIIRTSNYVCTIQNTSVLAPTAIASGTGYIYVPAALVDRYKAATNWSVYADQFRAIEDYPEICDTE